MKKFKKIANFVFSFLAFSITCISFASGIMLIADLCRPNIQMGQPKVILPIIGEISLIYKEKLYYQDPNLFIFVLLLSLTLCLIGSTITYKIISKN